MTDQPINGTGVRLTNEGTVFDFGTFRVLDRGADGGLVFERLGETFLKEPVWLPVDTGRNEDFFCLPAQLVSKVFRRLEQLAGQVPGAGCQVSGEEAAGACYDAVCSELDELVAARALATPGGLAAGLGDDTGDGPGNGKANGKAPKATGKSGLTPMPVARQTRVVLPRRIHQGTSLGGR